jgi:hypothetical protein
MHGVADMRRDILIRILAAATAVLMPLTLHFYNKARALEEEVATLRVQMQEESKLPRLSYPLGAAGTD